MQGGCAWNCCLQVPLWRPSRSWKRPLSTPSLCWWGIVRRGMGTGCSSHWWSQPTPSQARLPMTLSLWKIAPTFPLPWNICLVNSPCRLYEYLDNNGGYQLIHTEHDGDCCFGAMKRGTTWTYEVADAHVRRMVLKAICNFPDFFFELYKHSLAMTYGLDRDSDEVLQQKIQDGTATPDYLGAQRLPGPFSFVVSPVVTIAQYQSQMSLT